MLLSSSGVYKVGIRVSISRFLWDRNMLARWETYLDDQLVIAVEQNERLHTAATSGVLYVPVVSVVMRSRMWRGML